jgi:hypothetical protein
MNVFLGIPGTFLVIMAYAYAITLPFTSRRGLLRVFREAVATLNTSVD